MRPLGMLAQVVVQSALEPALNVDHKLTLRWVGEHAGCDTRTELTNVGGDVERLRGRAAVGVGHVHRVRTGGNAFNSVAVLTAEMPIHSYV